MSDGNDDFLARWSRRKRAARNSEAQTSDEEAQAAGATPAEADADPQAAATEPPEPLPSLEDLTADSDLVAFLREGVPAALKNAAMRKMWSLDPTIRDYIGPSEYAWDFNQPGSMAGFGGLRPTASGADFLSVVSRAMPAEKAATVSEAPPSQVTAVAPGHDGSLSPTEPTQQTDTAADPAEPGKELESNGEPAEETGVAELPRTRPRHGGALPR